MAKQSNKIIIGIVAIIVIGTIFSMLFINKISGFTAYDSTCYKDSVLEFCNFNNYIIEYNDVVPRCSVSREGLSLREYNQKVISVNGELDEYINIQCSR